MRNLSIEKRLLSTSLLLTIVGWSLGAAAQSDTTASAARSQSGTVLQEVIVTAQKRSERLQDVPVSIAVLDSSQLESRHTYRLQDYFAQVPGLALNAADGGRITLAIRGITTGGGTNTPVGITIDDVPIGATAGFTYAGLNAADIDPATLERVEVLRGPQGTLYGAASLGGLLRYVTARPKMNEFSGRFQADGSTVTEGGDGYGIRGSANIPLVDDKLAATASAFFRHDPGVIDDPGLGTTDVDSADTWGGRISVLWQPTENVSLRGSVVYQEVDGDGSSNIEADSAQQPGDDLTHNDIAGTGIYERKRQHYDFTANVNFGWAELTSVSGYGVTKFLDRFDVTEFLGFLTFFATGRTDLGSTAIVPNETKKFSQEIRLASPSGGKIEWLLGAFYQDEDTDVAYNIYGTDPATGEIIAEVFPDSFPSSLEEKAIFGAATYRFTDRFDVQIGGRSSRNEQIYDELITGPLFDPPYTVHAESKDDSFTYLFSPRFRISPDMMVYGRVATGYRPGGPNPGAGFGFPAEFDPDTTINYELGMKGNFLDGRLSLEVAAYYIDWEDIQLLQRDPATEFAYYSNAGSARSQGVELTLQAAPSQGMSLAATLGYGDAELSEPTSGGAYALAGDALPFSADWNASASVDKEFALNETLSGFVGGTVTYLGERPGAFAPSATVPRVVLPSFTTFDLRAGVRWSGWTLSAFANNLTDERGLVGGATEVASGATGVFVLNIIRPRTIGLSMAREF